MRRTIKEIQQGKLQTLLKHIRQDKGITQVELAGRLNVPQSYISKYESGDRRLDILELRQICNAIGISLQEFTRKLEDSINETE